MVSSIRQMFSRPLFFLQEIIGDSNVCYHTDTGTKCLPGSMWLPIEDPRDWRRKDLEQVTPTFITTFLPSMGI